MSILRADSIRNRAGTGAPDFPNGATVTGVVVTGICTATSFSGDGSALTGIDAGTLKHNSDTKAQATATGVDVTGNLGVSGDATVTGNLTVNGTTTTIDTAVTAVDSLAVDGNVAIGTVTAGRHLTVSGGASEGAIQITNNSSGHTAANGFELIHFTSGETQFLNRENGDMRFDTNGTERFRIKSSGTAIFKGGLAEKINVKTQLTGANSCAITDGNVILTTTNEPGNTYPDITGVNNLLTIGQGFSITIALKVNGSGTINSLWIEGWTQSIKWSGGSAPSAGASGHDVFTFTVVKTGNGTSDYTVFGAATNYA